MHLHHAGYSFQIRDAALALRFGISLAIYLKLVQSSGIKAAMSRDFKNSASSCGTLLVSA